MRTTVLAANWKMFKTRHDTREYVRELASLVGGNEGVEIVIAPPATSLSTAAEAAQHTRIGVAAQNLYFEAEGAFTGEISAAMIVEAGARYVIVGHSERRRLFGDTDAVVYRKVRAALSGGLVPIVCIGETLAEREGGKTMAVLDEQMRVGLEGLSGAEIGGLIIAYEPVWAIGTGKNATPAEAGEAHTHIRTRLREMFGAEASDQCRLLYGGSVKPDNIKALVALADVDGALIGGASLDVHSFGKIIANAGA